MKIAQHGLQVDVSIMAQSLPVSEYQPPTICRSLWITLYDDLMQHSIIEFDPIEVASSITLK